MDPDLSRSMSSEFGRLKASRFFDVAHLLSCVAAIGLAGYSAYVAYTAYGSNAVAAMVAACAGAMFLCSLYGIWALRTGRLSDHQYAYLVVQGIILHLLLQLAGARGCAVAAARGVPARDV